MGVVGRERVAGQGLPPSSVVGPELKASEEDASDEA